MFFKIDFLDFRKFIEQRFDTEEILPVSYFETENSIYLFKPKICIIYWTEVDKNNIENIDNFKMEFLSNAVVLMELPFTTQRTVI